MNNCRKVLWFAKALNGPRRCVAIGCFALILSVHGASAQGIASYDCTRFNWDNNGSILWTFTPAGYTLWAGSAQITNATQVADPNRQFI